MPDFTRLLAIGLLNFADDHGYFWANPLLIRGAIFPFDEDSSKVRRSLAQLHSEGFVRLGKAPDGRECGLVVNFSKHQRVDRPKDSEIKPLIQFDDASTNDRRLFNDESSLEGKGMEGKGNEKEDAADAAGLVPDLAPEVREALNRPDFHAAWADWMAYRRERKLPTYKSRALIAQFNTLAGWGVDAAIASIRESIRQQWQGLFQPKTNGAAARRQGEFDNAY